MICNVSTIIHQFHYHYVISVCISRIPHHGDDWRRIVVSDHHGTKVNAGQMVVNNPPDRFRGKRECVHMFSPMASGFPEYSQEKNIVEPIKQLSIPDPYIIFNRSHPSHQFHGADVGWGFWACMRAKRNLTCGFLWICLACTLRRRWQAAPRPWHSLTPIVFSFPSEIAHLNNIWTILTCFLSSQSLETCHVPHHGHCTVVLQLRLETWWNMIKTRWNMGFFPQSDLWSILYSGTWDTNGAGLWSFHFQPEGAFSMPACARLTDRWSRVHRIEKLTKADREW